MSHLRHLTPPPPFRSRHRPPEITRLQKIHVISDPVPASISASPPRQRISLELAIVILVVVVVLTMRAAIPLGLIYYALFGPLPEHHHVTVPVRAASSTANDVPDEP